MLIAYALIVLLVTVLMMFVLKPWAEEYGLVDTPGGRKRHDGEIPMIGGLAMFVGIGIGLAMMPDMAGDEYLLLVSGSLLVVTGVLDDRFELATTVRFMAQLAAILVMIIGAGLLMRDIGDPLWIGRIHLGPFAVVVSILIFSSVINAFNMSDGLDGLAGSMSLIALVSIALVSPSNSDTQVLSWIIVASVGGFLLFNAPYRLRPFRAFMGDAGSTLLGLSVVWLMVDICQGPDRTISPVHGLWFAALPIFDLFTCFTLRVAAGQSPFASGRDHFHHLLMDKGISVPRTLQVLVVLQLGYSATGIACLHWGLPESAVFTIWAIAGFGQRRIVGSIGNVLVAASDGRTARS